MENITPENIRLLLLLSEPVSETERGEMRFCCRRIIKEPQERDTDDKKHHCALEEILAKKQRIADND